ncbi:MAG: hypothetical protein ACYS4W_11925 [Planctomycetota bacterium]
MCLQLWQVPASLASNQYQPVVVILQPPIAVGRVNALIERPETILSERSGRADKLRVPAVLYGVDFGIIRLR